MCSLRLPLFITVLIILIILVQHPMEVINSNFFLSLASRLSIFRIIGLCFLTYGLSFFYVKKLHHKFPQNYKITLENINPNVNVFAFDLHGVVFHLDIFGVAKELIKTPNKIDLLTIILNPKVISSSFKLLSKGSGPEETIIKTANKYPKLKRFIPSGLRVFNEQTPINKTVDLIKDLKNKGYKIFVFSNIGEKSIDILKERYPEIFGLFDGILATTPEDDYIRKPSNKSFEKFVKTFDLKKENIIFIDDKPKNIFASRSLGIPALLFTSPSSLRKILIKHKAL